MFTPLILLLGLIVATAVIAYWSDNLGKKLGKKRVTLLGLRPRTTATILTISSSWAIMLFTLAFLLITVTPLRHALFRYDRERAENQALRSSTRELREQSVQASQQASLAQRNLSGARQQLAQAQSQLAGTQNSLKRAQTARRSAESAQKTAQNRAQTARRSESAARTRESEARRGERDAQSGERNARRGETAAQKLTQSARRQLSASESALGAAQTRLSSIETRLGGARQRLQVANESYAAAQGRLARVQSRLNSTNASLRTASASLQRASRSAYAAARQVLTLETQRDELQNEISNLSAATSLFASSETPIKINQTFAARIIAPRQSVASIEGALRDLAAQGQRAFETDAATQPFAALGARLQLLPLPQQSGQRILFLQGEQIFARLARDILSGGQTTSVRLVAARNFLEGEKQIAVRFVAVPVTVAFRPGETLASAVIDGAAGDAPTFRALLDLTEAGQKEAARRGVNPPQSPDEPNFYAQGTNVALFEALRRLEASRRPQRVNLVAAGPLSTVEPLRVRFEVEASAVDS